MTCVIPFILVKYFLLIVAVTVISSLRLNITCSLDTSLFAELKILL